MRYVYSIYSAYHERQKRPKIMPANNCSPKLGCPVVIKNRVLVMPLLDLVYFVILNMPCVRIRCVEVTNQYLSFSLFIS